MNLESAGQSNRSNPEPRHPATVALLKFFDYEHLSPSRAALSRPCGELAAAMVAQLADSAELSAGLRKLLEAKDCFVRTLLEKP